MSHFTSIIAEADHHATRFQRCLITALALEHLLLRLGFHSISFNPPSAVWNGVRIPLGDN